MKHVAARAAINPDREVDVKCGKSGLPAIECAVQAIQVAEENIRGKYWLQTLAGSLILALRGLIIRDSVMPRLAALALFAITLEIIPGAWATEAITLPTMDLNCFAWCIAYPPQSHSHLQLVPPRSFGGEGSAPNVDACENHIALDCVNRQGDVRPDDPQPDAPYDQMALSTYPYLESKAFELSIQIRDSDISKGIRNCIYVEGEDRSPKRDDDDCRNVQPGSDYTDTFSILTIALITVLTLAAITFTWVMHRSYRIWRLRKYIAVAR
jgi:hypothetical protein